MTENQRSIFAAKTTGTIAAKIKITGESVGRIKTDDPLYLDGTYIAANTGSLTWGDGNHPRGMLGKTHSEEYKAILSINNSGSGNPMYGKKRPELAARNSDPILAAINGIKYSNHMLLKALSYYNLTKEEFEVIKNKNSINHQKSKMDMYRGMLSDINIQVTSFELGKMHRLLRLYNKLTIA